MKRLVKEVLQQVGATLVGVRVTGVEAGAVVVDVGRGGDGEPRGGGERFGFAVAGGGHGEVQTTTDVDQVRLLRHWLAALQPTERPRPRSCSCSIFSCHRKLNYFLIVGRQFNFLLTLHIQYSVQYSIVV